MTLDHKFVAGEEGAPVLLLLHGTGGGPDDLIGLARVLSPASPLLAPAGPVSEHGAARWFRRLGEGVFDYDDVAVRANQLADFVLAARERYGLPQRLVAVGFSNGANVAGATLLLRPEVLREAALFASMLPLPETSEAIAKELSGTRAFLSNGLHDGMAPLDSTERFVDLLRTRSAEVTTHRHPGGHQITMAAVQAAKDWLAGA